GDHLSDVILLGQDRSRLKFMLETPLGELVEPANMGDSVGQFVATNNVSYYRIPLPFRLPHGRTNHAGTWHAVVSHADKDAGGGGRPTTLRTGRQRYSVIVHA